MKVIIEDDEIKVGFLLSKLILLLSFLIFLEGEGCNWLIVPIFFSSLCLSLIFTNKFIQFDKINREEKSLHSN